LEAKKADICFSRKMLKILFFIFQIVGIFLFKQGFLLSRLELEDQTRESEGNVRFNKTLLVMIDALRFDFMLYQHEINRENVPHFINKLPIIDEKLKRYFSGFKW
jgi:predicted AlkP superfamily pyrophosphatase or phosphodiesterase